MIEINIDGLCEPINPGGTACIGYVIRRGNVSLAKVSKVIGIGKGMTNNVAEYTALIEALTKTRELGLAEEQIKVKSDSKLVVNQMNAKWRVKASHIIPLHRKAMELARGFDIVFEWVPREENAEADSLCRIAYEGRSLCKY